MMKLIINGEIKAQLFRSKSTTSPWSNTFYIYFCVEGNSESTIKTLCNLANDKFTIAPSGTIPDGYSGVIVFSRTELEFIDYLRSNNHEVIQVYV